MGWNFGDLLDEVAGVVPPDFPALIHNDREILWGDFNTRTNRLARALGERGAKGGDKVAFYMRNRPAYLETLVACFKGRFVHVNVNYRYQTQELEYIFDNSDARVVVFEADFRDQIQALKGRLSKVVVWVELSPDGETLDFAESFETLASQGDGSRLDIKRSPDDLLFLYTGGTTGMPKGVMWPQGAIREAQLEGLRALGPAPETMEQHLAVVKELGMHGRQLPACPLMHGTGLLTAMGAITNGAAVVTLENKGGFDPEQLWAAVDRHKVTSIAIVGDAFAKPMLNVLDQTPDKYDVSSVQNIISSGVMWSYEVKSGLIKHMPNTMLTDSFGASEAVGFGSSIMTADGEVKTAKFSIGEKCKVFSEDEREIAPGSGEPGFIARGGSIPLGYYKDEEKTATTFKTINGVRYSIPGDWCTVEEDGTLTLLGRGSVCINTAGEKVYPEEIEEVLKEYPGVVDALVVGVADEKWGQAVTAVVQPENGAALDEGEVRQFVRGKLAGYKTPKTVLFKASLGRAPNGKADYKSIAQYAAEMLA
jgi:fatty-acyl-CoA synthase